MGSFKVISGGLKAEPNSNFELKSGGLKKEYEIDPSNLSLGIGTEDQYDKGNPPGAMSSLAMIAKPVYEGLAKKPSRATNISFDTPVDPRAYAKGYPLPKTHLRFSPEHKFDMQRGVAVGLNSLLPLAPEEGKGAVTPQEKDKYKIEAGIGTLTKLYAVGLATGGIAPTITGVGALSKLPRAAQVVAGFAAQSGTTFGVAEYIDIVAENASGGNVEDKESTKRVLGASAFGAGLGATGAIPSPLARIPAEMGYGFVTSLLQGSDLKQAGVNSVVFGLFGMLNTRNLSRLYDTEIARGAKTALEQNLVKGGMNAKQATSTADQIINLSRKARSGRLKTWMDRGKTVIDKYGKPEALRAEVSRLLERSGMNPADPIFELQVKKVSEQIQNIWSKQVLDANRTGGSSLKIKTPEEILGGIAPTSPKEGIPFADKGIYDFTAQRVAKRTPQFPETLPIGVYQYIQEQLEGVESTDINRAFLQSEYKKASPEQKKLMEQKYEFLSEGQEGDVISPKFKGEALKPEAPPTEDIALGPTLPKEIYDIVAQKQSAQKAAVESLYPFLTSEEKEAIDTKLRAPKEDEPLRIPNREGEELPEGERREGPGFLVFGGKAVKPTKKKGQIFRGRAPEEVKPEQIVELPTREAPQAVVPEPTAPQPKIEVSQRGRGNKPAEIQEPITEQDTTDLTEIRNMASGWEAGGQLISGDPSKSEQRKIRAPSTFPRELSNIGLTHKHMNMVFQNILDSKKPLTDKQQKTKNFLLSWYRDIAKEADHGQEGLSESETAEVVRSANQDEPVNQQDFWEEEGAGLEESDEETKARKEGTGIHAPLTKEQEALDNEEVYGVTEGLKGEAEGVEGKSLKLEGTYVDAIVAPSAKEPGKWQATYIQKDGTPSGDSIRDTFEEAVEEARRTTGVLTEEQEAAGDVFKEPTLEEEAQEKPTEGIAEPPAGTKEDIVEEGYVPISREEADMISEIKNEPSLVAHFAVRGEETTGVEGWYMKEPSSKLITEYKTGKKIPMYSKEMHRIYKQFKERFEKPAKFSGKATEQVQRLRITAPTTVTNTQGKAVTLPKGEEYAFFDIGDGKVRLQDGKQVTVYEGELSKIKGVLLTGGDIAAGGLTPDMREDADKPKPKKFTGARVKVVTPPPKKIEIQEKIALKIKLAAKQKAARQAALDTNRKVRQLLKTIDKIKKMPIEGMNFLEKALIKKLKEDLRTIRTRKGLQSLVTNLKVVTTLWDKVQALKAQGKTKYIQTKQSRDQKFELEKELLLDTIFTSGKMEKKPVKPSGKRLARATSLRPSRVLDALDGGQNFQGPFHQYFYDQANKAVDEELRFIAERRIKMFDDLNSLDLSVNDIMKKRTIEGEELTIDDMVTIYAAQKNPIKKKAITLGNEWSEEFQGKVISQMSENEKRLGDMIIDDYQKHWPRLRKAYLEYTDGKHDLTAEEGYTPIRRLAQGYQTMEEEIADELTSRSSLIKGFVPRDMTKKRTMTGEFQLPIRTGELTIWLEQIQKQEHFISHGNVVKDMHRMWGSPEIFKAINYNKKFGREYYQAVQHYINRVANNATYKATGQLEKGMAGIRRNVAVSYLSGNLVTMAKQFPSIFLGLLEADPIHMMSAMAQASFNSRDLEKFINESSPQMRIRNIEREMEELKNFHAESYDRIIKIVGEKGMKGIYIIDKYVTSIVWKSVYDLNVRQGVSHPEAADLAMKAVLRTQPAAHPKDIADMYATQSGLNWLLQFSNQLNQIYNMATYDIPMKARRGRYRDALGGMLGIAMSAMLITIISRGRWPEEDEWDEVAIQSVIVLVPIIGPLVVSAMNGFSNISVPALAVAQKAVDVSVNIYKEEYNKIWGDLAGMTALYKGIPSAQPKRTFKGATGLVEGEGDWRNLIWSAWTLKKSINRKKKSSKGKPFSGKSFRSSRKNPFKSAF